MLGVSYTMAYIPCFEEVYVCIRIQSRCFCEMNLLKAGFYCKCGALGGVLGLRAYGEVPVENLKSYPVPESNS